MCTCGLAYNYYVKVTLIEGQVLSTVSLNFTLLAFVSSKEGLKSKIQWNYLCRVLHVLLHSFSGVDFQMKMLIVDGEQTVLQLWDTAGQERQVLSPELWILLGFAWTSLVGRSVSFVLMIIEFWYSVRILRMLAFFHILSFFTLSSSVMWVPLSSLWTADTLGKRECPFLMRECWWGSTPESGNSVSSWGAGAPEKMEKKTCQLLCSREEMQTKQ